MFDFAWTEIALIGVVALIAIGPKDLPVAIKAVASMIRKARRMAAEFQGHVDEMVREADLHEVRDQFNQLRSFNVKDEIAKAVDGDGSLRATLNETRDSVTEATRNLMQPDMPAEGTPVVETAIAEPGDSTQAHAEAEPDAVADAPPAFIPPPFVPPAFVPPAFVPPGAVHTPSSTV